ncbi:sulfite exporter TauE/SafE family protein [Fontimonas sp. SYSU GA230001]|uniref:sulfite exporter TauE/SafE family protein n=1 Tax=Fontimonas sp. SYSU GA230001 TaxID=3142450 RepID=UPI0032B60E25
MIELTVPALLATGLAASPHCGLMCGALQVSMLHGRGALPMARAVLLLHAGRVAGYTLLGGAAGTAGQWLLRGLPAAEWGHWIQFAAALLLIGVGAAQYRRERPVTAGCHAPRLPSLLRSMPAPARVCAQGLLWAAMPCGLLYAVLGLAALSASGVMGALLLAAFGLGTTPLLTGSGALIAHVGGSAGLRRTGAAVLMAMGAASAVAVLLDPSGAAGWCRLGY